MNPSLFFARFFVGTTVCFSGAMAILYYAIVWDDLGQYSKKIFFASLLLVVAHLSIGALHFFRKYLRSKRKRSIQPTASSSYLGEIVDWSEDEHDSPHSY